MGKSTRAPILAAGGIVIRSGPKPLVAIVQRRRDNTWVLPKGKLKPDEKPIVAAKREATEETGCDVRVHEFLGVISNLGGNAPNITHFWRMQVIDESAGKRMSDIKAVEWPPVASAPAVIHPDAAAAPRTRSQRWDVLARLGKRFKQSSAGPVRGTGTCGIGRTEAPIDKPPCIVAAFTLPHRSRFSKLTHDPTEIRRAAGRRILVTVTRRFSHPCDRCHAASPIIRDDFRQIRR
jgi:8-oxo-dGTP pyrophosphatase MutT (NUDIX family)